MGAAAAKPEGRDRASLLLCSVMLLSTAAIFAVSADAPSTLLLSGFGLAMSALRSEPIPRSTRTYVYTAVTAMIVATLENQLFPVDADRFFLLSGAFYCPMLIYLAVGVTFFDQRQISQTSISCFCLLAAMLAGNVVGGFPTNRRFPFTDAAVKHFHAFFGVMTLILVLAMVLLIRRGLQTRGTATIPKRESKSKPIVLILAILVAITSVLGMRWTGQYFERRFQQFAGRMFRHLGSRRYSQVVFGKEVDLWRTMPHRRSRDKKIVLRARSEAKPGYLRGRVYYRYQDGRWDGTLHETALPGREAGGRRVYTVFDRPRPDLTEEAAPRRIDIFPARNFSSQVLFAPGGAYEFELIADGLRNSTAGMLYPLEWDQQAGYSVVTQASPNGQSAYAFPQNLSTSPESYLDIPSGLREPLSAIAASAVASGLKPKNRVGTVRKIVDYLQETCTYTLDAEMQPGPDPVIQFLTRLRRGHCELFATATVLMLRSQGIPARYVTGFVCAEPHPGKAYWVSRLEDAHAWTEAYLQDEQRWVLVEGTPASGVPDAEADFNWLDGFLDRATVLWHRLLASMKRGVIAEAIVNAFGGLFGFLRWLVWHPVRGGVLLAVLTWIAFRLRHRRRRQQQAASATPRLQLQAAFAALETHVRRHGISRSPDMTVNEFASHLSQADAFSIQGIADLLHDYQRLRFTASEPAPEEVIDFRRRTAAVLGDRR